MIKIAIGSDHRGFAQKHLIIDHFRNNDHYMCTDVGTHTPERTDYPTYALKVVEMIQSKQVDLGILLCGSGIGMAIAANRHKYIYAGVVWNALTAQRAKEDDNVNVLVLPSDYIADEQVIPIVESWLHGTFKGGRYAQRINMIEEN